MNEFFKKKEVEMRVRTGQGNIPAKLSEKNIMKASQDLQNSMDTIFGLRAPCESTNKFRSLRDLYIFFTGDSSFHGVFNKNGLADELRASQAITSSSFPLALANTLNRFISIGYNKINYFENVLISQQKPASCLNAASFTQLGCWDDLPEVDPEAADYSGLPDITEKGNIFNLLQKGCALPISRKIFVNDDLNIIKGLMLKIGILARKTHARYVWQHFVNNTNSNDGTPWFSAEHGNLIIGEFDILTISTVITLLANMVEPGPSSDRIGLDLSNFKWHLVVPISMWDKAVKVNQTRSYFTSNSLTDKVYNPCYRLFGDNNERIATPPFLPENGEWGVVRDPSEVPILEMQYLHGKQEPEIYFEKNQNSDMAFSGDWFGLKVRHEYGGAISDHRGAFKAVSE